MAETKKVEIPAALVTNVGQATSGVLNSILTALAGSQLNGVKDNITALLGRKIMTAYDLKYANLVNVPDAIELPLVEDYREIIDRLKAGIVEGVGATHAGLYETLVGTSVLAGGYTGIIQRVGIDPYISRWANNALVPNIPDAETAWFMSNIGAIDTETYKTYLRQNGWSDSWIPALDMSWRSMPPISILLDLRRRDIIDDPALKSMLHWFRFSDTEVNRVAQLTIQYPEPYRLAEMYTKGLTSNDEYLGVTRIFGLEDKWATYWAEGQLRYPDFSTSLALLRRGEISEDTFYFWMQRSQISPSETEVMLKLKDVIPPISDLIRFAVREAFLDHDPEKQYPEMVRRAGLMGLTPQDAEHYWYSHWERIPVNLMYANYHRGLWDKAKLERMLKIVDVHPDDRQDIINVAYTVPSIREMGYGFDVGVYSIEDIKRFRRFGGLSPEDAEKAGVSMVAYRTEAERNAVRTELMYAYGYDRITKEDLEMALTELPTPKEAIGLWLTRAELYRERMLKPTTDVEGRTVSSSEALTAYKLGLIYEDNLRELLKKLFWTDERIEIAVARAKLELTEKEAEEAEVKYRKLTLAQLQKMYSMKLIYKEDFTTELILIGYNPDDADLLTEIYTGEVVEEVEPKPFTSTVAANMYALMMFDEDDLYDNFLAQDWTEEQAAMLTMYTLVTQKYDSLKTQYIKGTISGEQMVQELMKLEMPEYNARLLVKKTYEEYEIDRLSHEKDLTKAEIIKGVKNQVLTASQGAELLQGIGYDDSESWYILAINKVVEAGDPDGYWEMRKVTEAYKKAKGEKALDIPDELIMLEKSLKEAQSKLAELKKYPEREDEIKELALSLIPIEQRIAEIVKGLKEH